MSGTQHNDFLPMQGGWHEPLTPGLAISYNKDKVNLSIKRSSALSVFRSSLSLPGLGSLLFFKFSAVAAPCRWSCSALVLAALSVAVAGAQPADGWTIETVAGGSSYSGDGGPAVAAQLSSPYGVALDGAGNLFIADTSNQRIRKVDAAGRISTVAGDGTRGYGGDGGPAAAAQLFWPQHVALDGAGNLYIADWGNDRIRRLTPAPAPPPRIPAAGIVLATGTPAVNRISPNAIISVFGQEFAGTQTLNPVIDADGGIAVNLAATCLEIGGKRAPLFVVTPGQINAQVPHDLAPGEAALTVTRGCGTANEQRSAAASATVAAVSPAFFNVLSNLDGRNPLVALHGDGPDLAGAPDLGAAFTPAEPGEVVTLYGTGFGPTEPTIAAGRIPGEAAHLPNAAVAFTVGGIAVPPQDVLYAGASPCCAGLYQFAVRLPADVPDGDATVTATVQGVSTPEGPYLTIRGPQ